MELPNRMEFEASFARRLARLSSRHRAELRELLGNPPDPTNVPESFWQQVEQETREQSAVALYLLFLASGNYHASGDIAGEGLNSTASQLLNRQAEFYAGRRSSELAASYMATTRDRFGTLTDKLRRAAELETPLVRNEIEDDLTRIFGPDRAESVAVTETTGAQSAGGEAGTAITVGKSLEDQWVTEGDGKVCSICQPLHRTERPEWEKQFPDGPPAHVNCRCIIEYANKANAGGAAA